MQLRRFSLILLPCLLVLALNSCKKEHGTPQPPIPKIKTILANNDLRTYSYDDKGRVSQILMVLYGKYEYNYTDTGIVLNYYDTTGAFKAKTVYKLGAGGRAISAYSPNSPSDQTSYTYNSAGQLATASTVRTLTGQPTRRWDYSYYYTNSNLDSEIVSFNDGSTTTVSPYAYYDEYYTDKLNTLGNDNYGQAFLGVSSKNPAKVARDIGHDGNGNYPQTNYSYEYDAKNQITKQLHTWGTSSFTPLSFTYY